MPGTIVFRPLQANLTRDTEVIGSMSPFCEVNLNGHKVQGPVCSKGGKHPSWDDKMTLKSHDEAACILEVKNKNLLFPDHVIAGCKIDLKGIEKSGQVTKWFPLSYNNHPAGKLLVEITYSPDNVIPDFHQEPQHIIPPPYQQDIFNQGGFNQGQGDFNQGGFNQGQGGYNQGFPQQGFPQSNEQINYAPPSSHHGEKPLYPQFD